MKIIIAGSRDITQYTFLLSVFNDCDFADQITQVVSGCAKGVDLLGERWAISNGIDIKRFPPDWKQHGKSAGPIRNRKMAKHADV